MTDLRTELAERLGWHLSDFTGTNGDEVWWTHPVESGLYRDNPPSLSELVATGERRLITAALKSSYSRAIQCPTRSRITPRSRNRHPGIDFLLLTKRPENVVRMLPPSWSLYFPENAWIGTTVENQEQAEIRIPHLLKVPARVRFLSCEPLLEEVLIYGTGKTDWVIAGGESGPRARAMHPEWVRSLRDQCEADEVPFFFKQWGEFAPRHDLQAAQLAGKEWVTFDPDNSVCRVGKKAAGRTLDGREHSAFPG